jgi:hypothetical protein
VKAAREHGIDDAMAMVEDEVAANISRQQDEQEMAMILPSIRSEIERELAFDGSEEALGTNESVLYKLFLREAGVAHGPLGSKKKDDEPEFGTDGEEDPSKATPDFGHEDMEPDAGAVNDDPSDPPAEFFDGEDEEPADAGAEEDDSPFASQSAPMPKVGPGIRISGDKGTLEALQEALQEAESLIENNDDLADWCAMAWKTLASGIRRGEAVVNLPKFEAVPEDMDPDAGEDEE